MRSVNVTYKIYEFSELSEDVKAKVKEWYLNNFYQNEEFLDICKEELSHCFPKSDLKVQYSLSYCQGDGLNVYGTLNLKDVLYKMQQGQYNYYELEQAMQKSAAGKLLYLKITVMLIVWLIGLTLQKNGSIF